MKTFYSAQEIEDLARQGVRELLVDDNMVLTDLACQTAELLGVRLVTPGAPRPAALPDRSSAPAVPRAAQGTPVLQAAPVANGASGAGPEPKASSVLASKPRGCQHGPMNQTPLVDRPATAAPAARDGVGSSAVVDDLVNAVKQLSKKRA